MIVNLTDWLNEKLITPHKPSPGEIADLLHICDRDLEKVKIIELGPDWRLSLPTMPLCRLLQLPWQHLDTKLEVRVNIISYYILYPLL